PKPGETRCAVLDRPADRRTRRSARASATRAVHPARTAQIFPTDVQVCLDSPRRSAGMGHRGGVQTGTPGRVGFAHALARARPFVRRLARRRPRLPAPRARRCAPMHALAYHRETRDAPTRRPRAEFTPPPIAASTPSLAADHSAVAHLRVSA